MSRLLPLLLLFALLLPTSAHAAGPAPVKASDVLREAESFLGVPYVWGGFQPRGFDCSGYLSWVWKIPRRTTDTLKDMVVPIAKDELLPGDAMNNPLPGRQGHVRIFEKWATPDKKLVWVYEATQPRVVHRVVPYDPRLQPVRRINMVHDVGAPGAPGAATPERTRPVDTTPAALRLTKGTTALEGRVVDAKSGAAVGAARVFYWTESEQFDTKATATSPDGYFRAEGLSPGSYELAVYAGGYEVEFRGKIQVKPDHTSTVEAKLAPSGVTPAGTASLPLDHAVPGGHFYTQRGAGDGVSGYAVTNDGGVRLLDEYQRLGGPRALGYPVTRRFQMNGFAVQAFQKGVLQWRPEAGQAWLTNVLDELHARGKDDFLRLRHATPPQAASPGADVLNAQPAIAARYDEARHGKPTSQVQDMGNHFALRTQRAVLQLWKVDVPWAKAGETTVANGGDVAKEAGLLPVEAVASQRSPILGR